MSDQGQPRPPRDEALETYARGIIDEALGQCSASPRDFGSISTEAARRIAEYVLGRYKRADA